MAHKSEGAKAAPTPSAMPFKKSRREILRSIPSSRSRDLRKEASGAKVYHFQVRFGELTAPRPGLASRSVQTGPSRTMKTAKKQNFAGSTTPGLTTPG